MQKPVINEQKIIDLSQVPDDQKEEVKCKNCFHEIFIAVHLWHKVKIDDNYTYVPTHRSMCANCQRLLDEQP